MRSPLSPALPLFPVQPTLPETSEDDESLTPPRGSGRTSFMSWEEVGGLADQEVPIDARYYQKSGSISAKIGHNIRTAMRKKSQSRSSHTSSTKTSPPTSPQTFTGAIQSFSRRGSETSVSPSHLSFTRSLLKGSPKSQKSDLPQRHPSITSLYLSQVESSENSILLQHQLSADPSPMAYLPRADLSDPRIHSSKLSPFPGISQLERRDPEGLSSGRPPFLHQNSDSVVLSQRITPASSTLHGLPLQPTYSLVSRRDSDDGVAKRGWLAKALSQQYSPRLSGSVSRQGSNPDATGEGIRVGRQTSGGGHPSPTLSSLSYDPFAGPPLPQMDTTRHRSASPSVSIVPEDSEEGSRLTRFTMTTHRIEHASPVIEDEEESQVKGDRLPQKSIEVLNRMDALLALASDDPTRPDILDDPPRKLLLATQVLHVVNMHVCDLSHILFSLISGRPRKIGSSSYSTIFSSLQNPSSLPAAPLRSTCNSWSNPSSASISFTSADLILSRRPSQSATSWCSVSSSSLPMILSWLADI